MGSFSVTFMQSRRNRILFYKKLEWTNTPSLRVFVHAVRSTYSGKSRCDPCGNGFPKKKVTATDTAIFFWFPNLPLYSSYAQRSPVFFLSFLFFLLKSRLQSHFVAVNGGVLVGRLAHSAELRSRLRHSVSSAPSVAYSTGCSRVVNHPGTNPARQCLTSVIWREPVYHRHLAVDV